MTVDDRIAALVRLASDWQDPEYEPRDEAVRATLEVTARYTEEGLAFALNDRVHRFTEESLHAWVGHSGEEPEAKTVAVSDRTESPLGGLDAVVAALLLGHRVVVDAPTPLAAAFADAFAEAIEGEVYAAPRRSVLAEADAWIVACRPEDEGEVRAEAEEAGLAASRVIIHRRGEAVAVIDGREDHAALSGLAEDLLLHEGLTPASPRIVWAPAGTSPDDLLNALAGFRELFPVHPDTDGALRLPTAFLEAAGQPHATGPGFLVSLGAPEVQGAAHIRWSAYDDLSEVELWVEAQGAALSFIVAAPDVGARLEVSVPIVAPGDAHRPPLDAALPDVLHAR